MPATPALPLFALLFTVIIWGIGPVFIRTLSVALGPADSLVIRYVLVAVAYLAGLAFLGNWRVARADWPRLLIVSLVGMVGYNIGSAYGFERASAGLGSLVIGTQPLLIALLAAALTQERLTLPALAGLAVALGGVAVLFVPDVLNAQLSLASLIGAGLIFLSGVAWAVYVVLSRPLTAAYGPYTTTAWSIIIAAVPMVTVLSFVSGHTLQTVQTMSLRNWLDMAFMAGLSTFVATITWNYGAARLTAAASGATLYLVPVIGVAAGALVLGETVTPAMLAGGGLILLGVAIAQFWPSRMPDPAAFAGLGALIFAVLMWGMVPVATRFMLTGLSPQAAMVLRIVPTGLIALAVLVYVGIRPIAGRDWPRILIAALLGNVGYHVLAHFGILTVPAVWTGIIFGLEPVFIALFAMLLAGDRLTHWFLGGLALALLGTAVLVLGSVTGTDRSVGMGGVILVTISTMGWGIYTVVLRPVAAKYGAFPVTCLTLGLSAFPMFAFAAPSVIGEIAGMNAGQIGVAAFLVIFATFGAVAAWNFGLNTMSSSRAGMFLYVQPAVAAAGGTLLLGERMTWPVIAGGILILAGVAVSQLNQKVSR